MSEKTFQLYFAGSSVVQLVETRFAKGNSEAANIAIRGKTSGAFRNVGTFQYTSGVQALCVLYTKSVIAHKYPSSGLIPYILGFQGSLAGSLDYALTKQPAWLVDMFGTDSRGGSLAQRLISRTNSHRKRPGPVVLGLNERALPADNIQIFWNGEEVETLEMLRCLHLLLRDSDETERPEEQLKTFLQKNCSLG